MPQRYRPLIAALFGTIEHAMFPQPGWNERDREVAEVSGLDMVELLQRLRYPLPTAGHRRRSSARP